MDRNGSSRHTTRDSSFTNKKVIERKAEQAAVKIRKKQGWAAEGIQSKNTASQNKVVGNINWLGLSIQEEWSTCRVMYSYTQPTIEPGLPQPSYLHAMSPTAFVIQSCGSLQTRPPLQQLYS